MLQNLAGSLKIEVLKDIYGRILHNKKIFRLNFNKEFIDNLSLLIKEKTFGPEEVIININEATHQLYFIMKGEIDL